MSRLIDFKNVKIEIKNKTLIENVYFTLEQSDFVFLKGKIGSGKTSFLKTIYAELKINNGSAKVFGYDLKRMQKKDIPFLRRKIGYIFQDFNFLNDRNIFENFVFVLKATGWTDSVEIKKRIKTVLSEVEMEHKKKAKPFELSGGELQRISLARAILNNPAIILADEPTGNLDKESSVYVTKKLFDLSKQGTSIIFVTHDELLQEFAPDSRIFNIFEKTMKEEK